MPQFVPVDGDPFATQAPAAPVAAPQQAQPPAPQQAGPKLVPVDHDPFAAPQGRAPGGGFLQGVDAAVRGAADMATFGYADEIAAKMAQLTGIGGVGNGADYQKNVDAQRSIDAYDEKNNFKSRLAGQIAGGVASAALLPGAPAAIATKAPVATAAAEGLLQGAAYGSGSAKEGERMQGAGMGAVGGAIGGAAGGALAKGAGKVIGSLVDNAQVLKSAPSREALETAAKKSYQQADALGVKYSQPSMSNMAQDLGLQLEKEGLDPALHPKALAAYNRIEKAATGDVTLGQVDTLRKIAKAAAGSQDADERRIGSMIVDHLDDYVDKAGPADVALGSGNPEMASSILKTARENWSALKRSDEITDAIGRAALNAGAAGSGGNIDNATRQAFKSILNNKSKLRGFTDEQVSAMKRVVYGTKGGNAARLAGKLAPTGAVSAAISAGLGAAVAGPAGAAVLPAAGFAFKAVGDATTKRAASMAEALARIPASQRAKMVQGMAANRAKLTPYQLKMLTYLTSMGGASVAPEVAQ